MMRIDIDIAHGTFGATFAALYAIVLAMKQMRVNSMFDKPRIYDICLDAGKPTLGIVSFLGFGTGVIRNLVGYIVEFAWGFLEFVFYHFGRIGMKPFHEHIGIGHSHSEGPSGFESSSLHCSLPHLACVAGGVATSRDHMMKGSVWRANASFLHKVQDHRWYAP